MVYFCLFLNFYWSIIALQCLDLLYCKVNIFSNIPSFVFPYHLGHHRTLSSVFCASRFSLVQRQSLAFAGSPSLSQVDPCAAGTASSNCLICSWSSQNLTRERMVIPQCHGGLLCVLSSAALNLPSISYLWVQPSDTKHFLFGLFPTSHFQSV